MHKIPKIYQNGIFGTQERTGSLLSWRVASGLFMLIAIGNDLTRNGNLAKYTDSHNHSFYFLSLWLTIKTERGVRRDHQMSLALNLPSSLPFIYSRTYNVWPSFSLTRAFVPTGDSFTLKLLAALLSSKFRFVTSLPRSNDRVISTLGRLIGFA